MINFRPSLQLMVVSGVILGPLAVLADVSPFITSRMVEPKEVGMSSKKLDEIGDFLDRQVDGKQLGGAIVLVAKDGKVVSLESAGMRSIEKGIPMSRDTLFRIHSMTKPIVSTVVMILYEEGLLALDDPISKWLPEFEHMRVVTNERSAKDASGHVTESARRQITLRHLLSHTAGFPQNRFQDRPERKDWLASEAYQLRERLLPYGELKQMASGMANLPLDFHPGEFFDYGPSTDVLGRLAEVVSGQSLDVLIAERILRPLGMNDTKFFITPEEAQRLCSIYQVAPDGGGLTLVEDETSDWSIGVDKTYFSAQGGLVSTVVDYFRFLLMLRNGGILEGTRILKTKTVRLMGENQLTQVNIDPGNEPKGFGFGLGFGILNENDHIQGPGGLNRNGSLFWLGEAKTRFFVDLQNDIIFILLQQRKGGPDIRRPIERMIYNALD